jgi:hypothetical protein
MEEQMGLPAHSNVFAVGKDEREEFIRWTEETTTAIRSLLSPPFQDLGYDPYWASFYPARVNLQPGKSAELTLRLKNYSNRTLSGKYLLKGYGNIIFEKKTTDYQLKPGETKDFPIVIKCETPVEKGIHITTTDIEYDHQFLPWS